MPETPNPSSKTDDTLAADRTDDATRRPDPQATDHPAGERQADQNAADEPAG